jgi:hypothetical protein
MYCDKDARSCLRKTCTEANKDTNCGGPGYFCVDELCYSCSYDIAGDGPTYPCFSPESCNIETGACEVLNCTSAADCGPYYNYCNP